MSGTMSALADPRRTIGNILQLGTIEQIDLAEATCRVRVGDIVTGDIPWATGGAGQMLRVWSPPSIGEQCMLLCPEGDEEGGIAVLGIFSEAHPAPSSDPLVLLEFKDGSRFSYDPEGHALKIELAGDATAMLAAPGGLKITADIEVEGDISLQGKLDATDKITSSADVIGGGKSLKDHKHTGVAAGGTVSGPPQ
jgi:phage baseplate assembly protein V